MGFATARGLRLPITSSIELHMSGDENSLKERSKHQWTAWLLLNDSAECVQALENASSVCGVHLMSYMNKNRVL